MNRLFCFLLLALAYATACPSSSHAQVSEIPKGWKKVGACQFSFLIPKSLKNLNVKGIDSCVVEFKDSRMRIAIDYGPYSGTYAKDVTMIDYKEELIEIDGKKAQIVTFKDNNTRDSRKFVAGLYILTYEAKDKMKIALNMRINVKSAEDLETAKEIFRSIRFGEVGPFTVEW